MHAELTAVAGKCVTDRALECSLAVHAARDRRARSPPSEAALRDVAAAIEAAAGQGLELHRIDLSNARARLLLELGRARAARECAEETSAAAVGRGYRVGVEEAAGADRLPPAARRRPRRSLRSREKPAPCAARAPEEEPARRAVRDDVQEARRVQLHEAAIAALEDHEKRGLPFGVYFRKYDFHIAHGPHDRGAQLVENILVEAMPPGANIVTIQDHGSLLEYSGSGADFHRSAPALLVPDAGTGRRWRRT